MTDTHLDKKAQQELRKFVERIENLNTEKQGLTDDIKEVFDAASDRGFDVKILRKVIKLKAQNKVARDAEQELIDLYLHTLEGDLFRRDEAA